MINPKSLNLAKRLIVWIIVALIVAIGIMLFGCVSMRGVLAGAMTDAAKNIVKIVKDMLPPPQSNHDVLAATLGSAAFLYVNRKWAQRKGLYAKNGK